MTAAEQEVLDHETPTFLRVCETPQAEHENADLSKFQVRVCTSLALDEFGTVDMLVRDMIDLVSVKTDLDTRRIVNTINEQIRDSSAEFYSFYSTICDKLMKQHHIENCVCGMNGSGIKAKNERSREEENIRAVFARLKDAGSLTGKTQKKSSLTDTLARGCPTTKMLEEINQGNPLYSVDYNNRIVTYFIGDIYAMKIVGTDYTETQESLERTLGEIPYVVVLWEEHIERKEICLHKYFTLIPVDLPESEQEQYRVVEIQVTDSVSNHIMDTDDYHTDPVKGAYCHMDDTTSQVLM